MRLHARQPRGSSLAGTMVFLVLVMLLWVGVYRQAEAYLRVEKACKARSERAVGAYRALAWGLSLLETGLPPEEAYSCRANVGGQTFVLSFRQTDQTCCVVSVRPATSGDASLPEAPAHF